MPVGDPNEAAGEAERPQPELRAIGRLWPLLVLLIALATLFPFFHEAGPLHRAQYAYDHVTFHHLAVAKNRAAEHAWLGFYNLAVDDAGDVTYRPYNRFPPLGYVLIKLAMLTQDGHLAGEIQAARMLMLAFFAGAAALAYLAVVQLTGRRPLALAATLVAFSSYIALVASDMVATEGVVDLFGTMLAFHGIARYRFPGGAGVPLAAGGRPRLGQLVGKAGIALLLGWHVCALLAPFLAINIAAALVCRDRAELRRLLLFGVTALVIAFAVLATNLISEYIALRGSMEVWNLPSFQAIERRAGWWNLGQHWPAFVLDQMHRFGLALVPYALSGINVAWRGWTLLGALGGVAVFVMAAANLRPLLAGRGASKGLDDAVRARAYASLALLPLAAVGVCWATGMHNTVSSFREECPLCYLQLLTPGKYVVNDVYEAMFFAGAPLALFALLALRAPARWMPWRWPRWAVSQTSRVPRVSHPRDLLPRGFPSPALGRALGAALLATVLLGFVASVFYVGRLHRDDRVTEQEGALLADIEAIRELAVGKKVYGPAPRWPPTMFRSRSRYYFNGSVLIHRPDLAKFADFVVAPWVPGAETVTPRNRFYFLYRSAEYRRVCGDPVASSPKPGRPSVGSPRRTQLPLGCRNLTPVRFASVPWRWSTVRPPKQPSVVLAHGLSSSPACAAQVVPRTPAARIRTLGLKSVLRLCFHGRQCLSVGGR